MLATAWRKYQKLPARGLSVASLPPETFYPVPSAVERGRRFDAPRTYPNATLVAHQWGHFYSKGHIHELGQRPLPAYARRPRQRFDLATPKTSPRSHST